MSISYHPVAATKLIVVQDCTVNVAFLPTKTFTEGEEVLPNSRYYWVLLWSGLATDTGEPPEGTEDPEDYPQLMYSDMTPPSPGYIPIWDETKELWVPGPVSGGAGAHTHSAADIIGGVFDITRLPVAAHGESSTTKIVRADDPRLSGGGGGPIAIADVTGLQTELDGKSDDPHSHAVADVTGLQSVLDGKADDAHGHGVADVTGLQAALDGKADDAHGHAVADVTGLQAALDGKSDDGHVHVIADLPVAADGESSPTKLVRSDDSRLSGGSSGPVDIADVTGLQAALDSKSDDPHTHAIADTTGLQAALDGKSDDGHTHAIADTTGLQAALDGKAASVHSHAIADTTGLQAALDGKAASVHGHAIADTTGLQAALDGKAASVHGHAIADVTGLQAALDSKPRIVLATVGTAALTVAKTTTIADYTLAVNDILAVTFTLGTVANNPTLAVNGGAAIPIWLAGAPVTAYSFAMVANGLAHMRYDGTRFHLIGTYGNNDLVSQVNAEAGTQTTAYWWTPQRVSQAVKALAPVKTNTGTLTITNPVSGDVGKVLKATAAGAAAWEAESGGGEALIATTVVSGTTYTTTLADAQKCVETTNNGGTVQVTLPLAATVAYPIGTVIHFCQIGTSVLSVVNPGGATHRTPASATCRTQNSTITARLRATDDWVFSGDMQ